LLPFAFSVGSPCTVRFSRVLAELKLAFADVYNLDYPEATAHARRAIALGPDSSRAHRGLASVLWLHMLFQRGAVSIDHYLGSFSKSQANLPKPDPVAAEEFKRVVARAIDLGECQTQGESEGSPGEVRCRRRLRIAGVVRRVG
jgi:hypothetical protein